MPRYTPMIIVALALAPAALTAQVQERSPEGRGRVPNPAARVLELREELGLTAPQVLQLQRISGQTEERTRAAMERLQATRPAQPPRAQQAPRPAQPPRAQQAPRPGQPPRAAEAPRAPGRPLGPEMRRRVEQYRDSVRSLTPEQREALRAQTHERMTERRDSVRARLQDMTPEQRAELRERAQRRPGAMVAPRAADGRAGEQRARIMEARPELRELQGSMQQAIEQVNDVLTAEQREKLRALNAGRAPRPGLRRTPPPAR